MNYMFSSQKKKKRFCVGELEVEVGGEVDKVKVDKFRKVKVIKVE